MSNYSFAEYEEAVLEALAGIDGLQTLKGYAGELDEQGALEQFRRGFPGILVEISEAEYEIRTMPCYQQIVTVNVMVGDRSYRSQDEARAAGVYNLLAAVRGVLLGKTLGLEIRPLVLRREVKLASSPSTVLYLAQYQIINDYVVEA